MDTVRNSFLWRSSGQPWPSALSADQQTNGAPDVIDGHGYVVNQNMAQMGANNRSVLFGDFQSYKWRDVVGPGSNAGMRLRKLVELFAQSDQTAYAALCRFDGDLKNAGDDPVQALIHPAS